MKRKLAILCMGFLLGSNPLVANPIIPAVNIGQAPPVEPVDVVVQNFNVQIYKIDYAITQNKSILESLRKQREKAASDKSPLGQQLMIKIERIDAYISYLENLRSKLVYERGLREMEKVVERSR